MGRSSVGNYCRNAFIALPFAFNLSFTQMIWLCISIPFVIVALVWWALSWAMGTSEKNHEETNDL